MYSLNNQFLLLTVLVICCCDVILSAPQYKSDENNDQSFTENEEGTTEIIQEEIIPVNNSGFLNTFVPVSPLIYSPPMLPYNTYNPSFFYQPYFIPPAVLPNIPPATIPIQPFQPPVEANNIYLDYDENNNLISNSTLGFQPVTDDAENTNSQNNIQNNASRFRPTSNKQTYVTPIKSIKKHEYRTTNQESYIVAETYIRPNEKPKTIIRVYYDPSQNRENITIVDPDSSKVIEIESNVVNEHVVTNTDNGDTVSNPTTAKPVATLGGQATEYSAWPFGRWGATEATTESTTEPTTEPTTETATEPTTEPTTEQTTEESYEDVTRETTNDVSDEEDEADENEEDDDEEAYDEVQRDDHHAIVPESILKKKINDKKYERIPKKWLNLPTTERVVPSTSTETVPIWLRKSYTTPKIFAFNYATIPNAAGNIPPKTNDFNRGWFSWKQPVASHNPTSWNVETTTQGLRFAFFR